MTGTADGEPAGAAAGSGIDIDTEAMIAFAQQLVRVRSVNDPAHGCTEAGAAALVAQRMRDFGWAPTVTEVAPGRPNVTAVVDGGGGDGRTLLFAGHTDVVTEGPPQDWTVDPYAGVLRGGRLHGRGSADMKAGLASMLYAVRGLQLAGPFPGRITVAALVDEEGMMLGAKHLAASGALAGVDGAIVGEPEAGEVCASSKGSLRIRIDLHGRMAHGAMPEHGRNPIAVVGHLLLALASLQDRLQQEHGAHEHLGLPYLTPTVLRAGAIDQLNVIPALATVGVDVRTVPDIDHATLVADIGDTAASVAAPSEVRAEVTVIDDRPAVDTPIGHPVVAALAAAHEAVTGEPARFGGVPGATDGTILTRDAGLATVVYGPGGKWIAHQADEFVEVAEIVRCARVFAEAARRFLGAA